MGARVISSLKFLQVEIFLSAAFSSVCMPTDLGYREMLGRGAFSLLFSMGSSQACLGETAFICSPKSGISLVSRHRGQERLGWGWVACLSDIMAWRFFSRYIQGLPDAVNCFWDRAGGSARRRWCIPQVKVLLDGCWVGIV